MYTHLLAATRDAYGNTQHVGIHVTEVASLLASFNHRRRLIKDESLSGKVLQPLRDINERLDQGIGAGKTGYFLLGSMGLVISSRASPSRYSRSHIALMVVVRERVDRELSLRGPSRRSGDWHGQWRVFDVRGLGRS